MKICQNLVPKAPQFKTRIRLSQKIHSSRIIIKRLRPQYACVTYSIDRTCPVSNVISGCGSTPTTQNKIYDGENNNSLQRVSALLFLNPFFMLSPAARNSTTSICPRLIFDRPHMPSTKCCFRLWFNTNNPKQSLHRRKKKTTSCCNVQARCYSCRGSTPTTQKKKLHHRLIGHNPNTQCADGAYQIRRPQWVRTTKMLPSIPQLPLSIFMLTLVVAQHQQPNTNSLKISKKT